MWRRLDGEVAVETLPFSPVLLTADAGLVRDGGGLVALTPLPGTGELRWLARYASWPAALAARDRCRDRSGQPPGAPAAPYRFFPDPVHQYLLLSGRTSFGDLDFGDLRRLALDIEVLTSEGYEFPSARRAGDRVIAIALADSTGFRHVVRGDRLDERTMLEECTRIIRERDPDVIEGHNVFRFDLEYLEERARQHGVSLAWGRDGRALAGRPARLTIMDRTLGYRRYEVAGRHVIDTWILAQLHDAGARDLPGFGLKEIARHLGVAAADRTYVDGRDISRAYRETPDRLMAYALDDVIETLGVAAILSPPYFAQAQVVPFDYQSTALRGAAAKIDALLVREYLHRGRAVPRPRPPAPVGGGLVAMFQQGVARPALHVDVTSLYPSLMLASGIAPATDELGVFLELLRRLTAFRVSAKRLARETGDPRARARMAALQQSFKILINAFYGYLAFGPGHFNDFGAADRVTAEGRALVTGIIERLGELAAVPIEADTDGVYFMPPPGHRPAADEALLARVAAGLPEGIRLELDGRYAAMLSYKLKTYALLDDRGRVSLKGSGFRSRGLEPFQRRLIEEVVHLLLLGRGPEVKAVVDRWLDDFATRRVPARLFARTETLGETLESYRERVRAGARNASAAYELAAASGRAWLPGDQVSYYVAGRGANIQVNESARLLGAWDPDHRDENVEFYQARVLEVWERFRPFVDDDGLRPPADSGPPDSPQLSLFW
ncbi:MAG: DNA polymerase domain-containing protein [Candidatus Rokuibacteriota bacterium]